MNKKLWLSNLCWMTITLVVITHSCKQSTSSNSSTGQTPAACTEDDGVFLDASFFLDGIERYRQHQWTASNSDLKVNHGTNGDFQDAKSCWYSLFRLKRMICLIEENAKKHPEITGELGIRFYYATYPDGTKQAVRTPAGSMMTTTTADVSWHHTLFMVPTAFNDQTNLEQDIFMLPSTVRGDASNNGEIKERGPWSPTKPDWELLKKHKGDPQYRILAFGAAIPTSTPSSINQGMLCPPTCVGGEETIFNMSAAQKISQ